MGRTSTALVLIATISFVFAGNAPVNWSSDGDSLPEVLPKKMVGKTDDEVQKAVFQAYTTQLKVISEYNGHVLEPDSPYGFFKDEMPISNARTSNPQTDLVFYNNAIRGFIGHDKNSIIVKWNLDQVLTEIGWKELSVRGKYTFMNSTYFDQGKYVMLLQDLKYLATTTLSENTESYPSTVPKSSISFKNIKVTFTGALPTILKIGDSSNVKYFAEDIISQQVADRIVKDTHNNITAAIRQTVKPYIIFKSDTDGSFAAVNGKLPAGSIGYTLSNIILNGFTNLEQKLKKTTAKKATNSVTADLRMSIHNLEGRFDYKIDESKPVTGKATVTVGRIDVNVSFNMLKPAECKADVTVNLPNVKYATKISADSEKALTNSYVDGVKSHLSANVCKAIGQMFKP